MPRNLKFSVHFKDGVFVARCLDVEVEGEGDAREKAVANLQDALVLFFENKTAKDARHKTRYKLADLLNECQTDAEPPRVEGWDEMTPMGKELL